MKAVELNAIITGIRSKVDRSLGLSISTPELSTNEKALFMEMQGLNVRLTVEPVDEPVDSKEVIDTDLDTKTPSQRLRSVLFVLYKQIDPEQKRFDEFYREYMEKIIDSIKSKLDQ